MTSFAKMKQDEFEALVASKGKEAVAWLIEQYASTEPYEVYPKITNAEGKKVADKTQPPKIEYRAKSFISIKSEFAAKFAPELAPKAKEKTAPSRADRAEALKKLLESM